MASLEVVLSMVDTVGLFLRAQGSAFVPMVGVKFGKHMQSLGSQGGLHMKPTRFVLSSPMQPKFIIPLASWYSALVE